MQPLARSKKPTNLSLDQLLLAEARALGINLSNVAESGLRKAVAETISQKWKRANAKALQSSCDWVDQNGLPLEKYRQF